MFWLSHRRSQANRARAAVGGRRAFTMVELLVVIGIVVLLLSILLPAVSAARERSRRTACLSNLRQIGAAMIMYANQSRGRYPNSNPPLTTSSYADANRVLTYLATVYLGKSAAVFHCPSDVDPVPERIETADYDLPNSARVSYDFYTVFWVPEKGPIFGRLKGEAPMAWDLDGGSLKHEVDQNHGIGGGNVVFADGHGEWQVNTAWDGANWPNPAAKYYDR